MFLRVHVVSLFPGLCRKIGCFDMIHSNNQQNIFGFCSWNLIIVHFAKVKFCQVSTHLIVATIWLTPNVRVVHLHHLNQIKQACFFFFFLWIVWRFHLLYLGIMLNVKKWINYWVSGVCFPHWLDLQTCCRQSRDVLPSLSVSRKRKSQMM